MVAEDERRLLHEARVIAAATGEPLRDWVLRAMRRELERQRREMPDLLKALDRLRAQSAAAGHNGTFTANDVLREATEATPAS